MFSQACVQNSVHGGRESGRQTRPLAGRHPPGRQTSPSPWQADIPPLPDRQTSPLPLAGRHPLLASRQTPPPGRHPPPGRPLQRTVRILLECILVNNPSGGYISDLDLTDINKTKHLKVLMAWYLSNYWVRLIHANDLHSQIYPAIKLNALNLILKREIQCSRPIRKTSGSLNYRKYFRIQLSDAISDLSL